MQVAIAKGGVYFKETPHINFYFQLKNSVGGFNLCFTGEIQIFRYSSGILILYYFALCTYFSQKTIHLQNDVYFAFVVVIGIDHGAFCVVTVMTN